MSDGFLLLTAYVFNAVWQVAVLGAAGSVLSRWVKPTGPELQHKVWVATLITATCVPATPVIDSYFFHEALTSKAIASSHGIVAPIAGRYVSLTGSGITFRPVAIYFA